MRYYTSGLDPLGQQEDVIDRGDLAGRNILQHGLIPTGLQFTESVNLPPYDQACSVIIDSVPWRKMDGIPTVGFE